MAKRKTVQKKAASKQTTARSRVTKKTVTQKKAASTTARSKATVKQTTSRSSTHSKTAASALSTAFAQGAYDVAAISEALHQAQLAQASLASAYEQLREVEVQQEEDHLATIQSLENDREDLRAAVSAAQVQDVQQEKEVQAAIKQLRGLVSSLSGMHDPLAPLTSEDDDSDLQIFREQLSGLSNRKSGDLESLPAVQDALQIARELADVIAGRIKLQSNRMKAARKDIELLQHERDRLLGDVDNYASQQQQLQDQMADAESNIQRATNSIQRLQEDLEAAQSRGKSLEQQQAESDEANASEQEALNQEIANAVGRADELSKKLNDSRELARKTERATVDFAEIVLSLADADAALPKLIDLPPAVIARDELESLIGDAGDDWDDEVDNLFRDDLGDDLASAARNVADNLINREKKLAEALQGALAENANLSEQGDENADLIEELEQSMQSMEAALNRSTAQLEAVTEEFDTLSAELSERHKELNDAQTEIGQLTTSNSLLEAKAVLAEQLKEEVHGYEKELEALQKAHEKLISKTEACDAEQRRLARSLVDLAGAAESALGNSSKGGGRFTKTYKKLDDVATQADIDSLRIIKNSLEVVDKLSTRVSQLAHELHQRNDSIAEFEKYAADMEKRFEKESSTLTDRESVLKTLKLDNQELNKSAKRALKLDEQLEKRESQIAQLTQQLKDAKARLDDTEADLEEALAREEESRESLAGELSELKSRLNDEQKNRRVTESNLSDDRDEYESQITTLQTTIDELNHNLEERDDRIIELQSDLDDAGEQRARIAELEHRAATFQNDLETAMARNRQLESELDNQEAVETLEDELHDAHAERDALMSKVRDAEKRLADEKGKAASLKSMNDSLNKKIDDKAAQHRRELDKLQEKYDAAMEENRSNKVKLAGMNARRRTTSAG